MTLTFSTSIEVGAAPPRVFEYFTNPSSIVEWIGDFAVLDARPDGEFTLDIAGIPVRGRYLVVDHPDRIVVAWGHAGSSSMPPGSTEVEFTFSAVATGTLVTVEHRGLPDEHLASHRAGWPMFLDRLAATAAASAPGA